MFREMRRKKQALSEEECIDILINEPRGVLAVLGDDEYPYALPLSHVYVDGKIYFHGTIKDSHKRDAIERHEKVSYCVMDKGTKSDSWWYTFKSVIIFGKMRTIEDRDAKIEKLTQLGNKFFPSEEETKDEIDRLLDVTELYEITIDHISGKIVKEK
jgi:nitroimidazol reductase NimA-like FMN-containing flavoprotein (pyridoxamine 5'-phosphate oxidase superfamily)